MPNGSIERWEDEGADVVWIHDTYLYKAAVGILSLAQVGGMPGSFWHTDSRVRLACEVLGITTEKAQEIDWWIDI
jgi:hypothetical protein